MKPIYKYLLLISTLPLAVVATEPGSTGSPSQPPTSPSTQRQTLETYTVAASSIDITPDEATSSISVFNREDLQRDPTLRHLEDLVSDTPNLTFAGGSSRARFFQIRGIGEYDNFVEPVTPSVGLVIDGIDFSGFANIVSLFDVERVEVLRGPQSGLYGTQALAGLIYIESENPTDYWTGQIQGTVAQYQTYSGGAAIGGPLDSITENLTMRISVFQNHSDGPTKNRFTGKNQGRDQDEFTSRLKLHWDPVENIRLRLTAMYSDFQNGYDNFTLTSNSGSREVFSDRPGQDNQRSTALAFEAGLGPIESEIVSRTTLQSTKTFYSFDSDWINTSDDPQNLFFWQNVWGQLSPKSWFEEYSRKADRIRQEFLFRRNEGPWTTRYTAGVGFSHLQQDSSGAQNYPTDDFGPSFVELNNIFKENQIYTFGEIIQPIGDRHEVGATLRLEGRRIELRDRESPQFNDKTSNDEFLWGGNISYRYLLSDEHSLYSKLSRGYKGSGINADRNARVLVYDDEALYSVEGGWNFARPDRTLQSQLSLFAFTREDPQVRRWEIDPGFNFVLTQTNADRSYGYGAEWTTDWVARDWLSVGGSLGLLQSRIKAENIPTLVDGRDQAVAPAYTFTAYTEVRPIENGFVRLKVSGQDSFFYDSFHDGKASAYQIFDLWTGYRYKGWEFSIWIRNLFDTDYGTRSIYFGDYNDPVLDPDLLYVELGQPRQVGVTVRYQF